MAWSFKKRWFRIAGGLLAIVVAAIYLLNASWLAPAPTDPHVSFIAHRGVHQTFHRRDLTNDTCTAARIDEPRHPYLENTPASVEAAFNAGADIVEIDVHPTTDGAFAVFHDWTLDCRTNGTGPVRSHNLADLQKLDIGYGYTADGGATYPFRGKAIGAMPSLREMLDRFSGKRFLIDFKGGDRKEADLLMEILKEDPRRREAVWAVYGGGTAVREAKAQIPGLSGFTRRGMKDCLLSYILIGWSGHVPQSCHGTYLPVPVNVASFLWGWPNRFLDRMNRAGTQIILFGPHKWGATGSTGIDTEDVLADVPETFSGYIWTNRIETIAPAYRAGRSKSMR